MQDLKAFNDNFGGVIGFYKLQRDNALLCKNKEFVNNIYRLFEENNKKTFRLIKAYRHLIVSSHNLTAKPGDRIDFDEDIFDRIQIQSLNDALKETKGYESKKCDTGHQMLLGSINSESSNLDKGIYSKNYEKATAFLSSYADIIGIR
jgi:hypothetical protein